MSLRVMGALVALLLVLSGCSAKDAPKASTPKLPDEMLQSFDSGPALDLSKVRGPAVINVWASWCGPCRRELPRYQAFSQKYAGKVKVIGIDFQDTQVGKARELIKQAGVTFPLYRDPEGDMRSRVLPQLILLDAKGHVTYEKYIEITSLAHLEKLVEKHLGAVA
jgi:cytochrome c biogenesis protein CcmG/thiol:disulfide interchange protein DsbE